MSDIVKPADGRTFEEIQHLNEHGAEYWNAREFPPLLGHAHWRNFEKMIVKAVTSCQHPGNDPTGDHFAIAHKMIEIRVGLSPFCARAQNGQGWSPGGGMAGTNSCG